MTRVIKNPLNDVTNDCLLARKWLIDPGGTAAVWNSSKHMVNTQQSHEPVIHKAQFWSTNAIHCCLSGSESETIFWSNRFVMVGFSEGVNWCFFAMIRFPKVNFTMLGDCIECATLIPVCLSFQGKLFSFLKHLHLRRIQLNDYWWYVSKS